MQGYLNHNCYVKLLIFKEMRFFITLILVSFFGAMGYSQNFGTQQQQDDKQHNEATQKGQQMKKHPSKEEIQSQKIAFFTQELELTPDEAQKFWPVYNQGWKKSQEARREINKSLRSLHEALKAETKASDSEIKTIMNNYFEACSKETKYQKEFFEELSKVVPVEKAAKTFSLEERFRVMLIKQLRK